MDTLFKEVWLIFKSSLILFKMKNLKEDRFSRSIRIRFPDEEMIRNMWLNLGAAL